MAGVVCGVRAGRAVPVMAVFEALSAFHGL